MKRKIPLPSIERLTFLYTILDRFEKEEKVLVSSAELGNIMNIPPHTLRKDISLLGQAGGESGYRVEILKETIVKGLGLNVPRKACIVGLGRLGSAIMNFKGFLDSNITIEAGFDSNINRLETFPTDIPLFPSYQISEVVKRNRIEIGVIAVPPSWAQKVADKLMEGGVKGILNFAPVVIKNVDSTVSIRNIHLLEEFRMLSALISEEREQL